MCVYLYHQGKSFDNSSPPTGYCFDFPVPEDKKPKVERSPADVLGGIESCLVSEDMLVDSTPKKPKDKKSSADVLSSLEGSIITGDFEPVPSSKKSKEVKKDILAGIEGSIIADVDTKPVKDSKSTSDASPAAKKSKTEGGKSDKDPLFGGEVMKADSGKKASKPKAASLFDDDSDDRYVPLF